MIDTPNPFNVLERHGMGVGIFITINMDGVFVLVNTTREL